MSDRQVYRLRSPITYEGEQFDYVVLVPRDTDGEEPIFDLYGADEYGDILTFSLIELHDADADPRGGRKSSE